jgi:hypothetical protein
MKKPFIMSLGAGAGLPFCEVECFHTYAYYMDSENFSVGKKLKPSKNICFHCASCGSILFDEQVEDCVMHDSSCPLWIWYSAAPIMLDFKEGISDMLGITQISNKIWDTADAVASVNQFISGYDLAYLTVNVLGTPESFEG